MTPFPVENNHPMVDFNRRKAGSTSSISGTGMQPADSSHLSLGRRGGTPDAVLSAKAPSM
jgi:hypothetical protein